MWHWFTHKSVRTKMLMLSAAFVLPITVLFLLLMRETSKSIDFALHEKAGNQYQRPLEDLLDLLPRHQWAAQACLNNPTDPKSQAELLAIETQIAAAFQNLNVVHARLGEELEFTPEVLQQHHRERCTPAAVFQEWEALRTKQMQFQRSASDLLHQRLITDVRTMITHAGDSSKLILDPDLDTYYLMDVTLLALPQAQERLAEAATCAADILRHPPISAEDKSNLDIYSAFLQRDDRERIEVSSVTSLNEDINCYDVSPTLHQKLPPALQKYFTAADRFQSVLEKIRAGDTRDLTPEQVLASGTEARTEAMLLWQTSVDELDTLLDHRIAFLERELTWAIVLVCVALLATVSFVVLVLRSINQPLAARVVQVEKALHRSEDDLEARMKELAARNEELNANARALT
ncbi:MAG TPA: hypothetical protein VL860_09250, partial [Planctomycetota bacterium]|nr:hypothetical protein [Planctomycetota bacterium]